MNKKAMYAISYGLFVVTAHVGDKDNGCTKEHKMAGGVMGYSYGTRFSQ